MAENDYLDSGIKVTDGYYVDKNVPFDMKTNYNGTREQWLSDFKSNKRYRGLTVTIREGSGTTAKPPKIYWFKDGVTDAHFIEYFDAENFTENSYQTIAEKLVEDIDEFGTNPKMYEIAKKLSDDYADQIVEEISSDTAENIVNRIINADKLTQKIVNSLVKDEENEEDKDTALSKLGAAIGDHIISLQATAVGEMFNKYLHFAINDKGELVLRQGSKVDWNKQQDGDLDNND